MAKQNIIYIYPKRSTFITNDIDFLEKNYTVLTQDLAWGKPLNLPINFLKQTWFLLVHIRRSKAIVINFGGYFSLLPSLFGKLFKTKTVIVLNGTDCVSFPSYNYGSLRKPLLRYCIKKSYQFASKLLPVDESLVFQEHVFDKLVAQKEQGFMAFFPNLKTPYAVISNGFDTQFWESKDVAKSGFVTVAFIADQVSLRLKGIDLILDIAPYFPKEKFTIIGMTDRIKNSLEKIPANVKILPFTPKETLRSIYQKSQYYLQLSLNEGFGCALSEAMLCACIPIVSNAGALPKLVANTGFIVPERNCETVQTALKNAIGLSETEKLAIRLKARERIANDFTISKREALLLQELDM